MSAARGQRVEGAFIGGHNIQIGSVSGDITLVLDRPGYRLELLGPSAPPRIRGRSGCLVICWTRSAR